MQQVKEFVLRHRSKFSQLILLNQSAKIIASCDSIFSTNILDQSPVTTWFPFLESIYSNIWTSISYDSNMSFTKIQTSIPQLPGIYDFTFSRVNIAEQDLILWSIYDYTDLYTDFRQFQQRKNELEIHRETLERRHKSLKNIEDIKIQQNIIIESLDHLQLTYFNKIKSALSSPVNALDGLTFLLAAAIENKDRKYTEQLRISLKQLSLILDELDEFATDQGSDFANEQFDILPLFEKVKEIAQLENQNQSITIKLEEDIPKTLTGNVLYLKQILLGLLANAFAHHLNSNFEIHVSKIANSASKVKLQFKVTEFLTNKMKLLKKDKYANMTYRLSIIKQLIDLQRGNIYVDKNPKNLSISITFDLEYAI